MIDTKAHPDGMTERNRAGLESLVRRTMQALELGRTMQAEG
ncbi:hypothetical protein [Sphingomonas sp. Leaf67]|nr:hypothetical protein [Sphingomonas sp. Leaf67]